MAATPATVTPPPAVVRKDAYFAISSTVRPSVTRRPSPIRHMSGFWQYWQRSGQPERNNVNRVPGPFTAPVISYEW